MKKTALAANVGLLLALGGYLRTVTDINFNGVELLLLVFALASPVASILALFTKRPPGLAIKLVVGLANTALLMTLFVYLIDHRPLQGLDLPTDWPVLVVLACMFIAPVLSILAMAVIRAVYKSNLAQTDGACSTGRE
jgi:hypothetical protein